MAIDIGYPSALGAGALSFLSPCVLPLVPPYLCYMAGVSIEDFRGHGESARRTATRWALFGAACAFVLGFSTVFVALGAGASTIGRFFAHVAGHAGDRCGHFDRCDGVEFPWRVCASPGYRVKRAFNREASLQRWLDRTLWDWRSLLAGRPA
jgi:hypothetical protein